MPLKYASAVGRRKLKSKDKDLATFQADAIPINPEEKLTAETRRQADITFDEILVREPCLGRYKLHEKRLAFQRYFHACKKARSLNRTVRYSRNTANVNSAIEMRVVEAMTKSELVVNYVSPVLYTKQSRLVPTDKLLGAATIDPWKVEDKDQGRLVYLFDRSEPRIELQFDPANAVALEYAEKLAAINDLNSRFKIKAHVMSLYDKALTTERQLRPMLFARFTNDFEHHGRLYTGAYGHQNLHRIERDTIRFGKFHSIEYDFAGMHVRMLYHEAGIDYREDPYMLWGEKTTEAARAMVKLLTNALINAKSSEAAVSSCNLSMSPREADGQWKTGKALRDSQMLFNASKKSGLTYKDLVPLVYSRHDKIADHFGTDAGLRLMNVDGRIALNVAHALALDGVPCLPCHDSFRVPTHHGRLLHRTMKRQYRSTLNHSPIIK